MPGLKGRAWTLKDVPRGGLRHAAAPGEKRLRGRRKAQSQRETRRALWGWCCTARQDLDITFGHGGITLPKFGGEKKE